MSMLWEWTATGVALGALAAGTACSSTTSAVTPDGGSHGPGDSGGGFHTAAGIRLGQAHTCARMSDGSVSYWGANMSGQLGDGTTTPRPAPTPVPALSEVVEIALGQGHTCARKTDGTVACWGDNT